MTTGHKQQHHGHVATDRDIAHALRTVADTIRRYERVSEVNSHGSSQETGGGSVMLMTSMNALADCLTAMDAAAGAIRQLPEFRP